MKKRFLAALVALAVALALLPGSAFAEDFDQNEWVPVYEEGLSNDFEYVPFNTMDDGRIYSLNGDETITSTITVNGSATLDLNGCVLKMEGSGPVIKITQGSTLTIQDSNPGTVHKFDKNAETGLMTLNETSGTETIYGGIITGGNTRQGAGITMESNSTLTMTGGTIVGCQSTNAAGGILLWENDTVTLSGTSRITGCTAPAPYGSAIGAALSCTLNLYGGLVEGDVTFGGTIGTRSEQPSAIYGDLYVTGEINVKNTLYIYGKTASMYGNDVVDRADAFINYKDGDDIYLSMC